MNVCERTLFALVLIVAVLRPEAALAQPSSPEQGTVVTAEGLREDLDILNQALLALHPGLHRYADAAALQGEFERLQRELDQDTPLHSAYLAVSRFVAQIKCGHTYANFWNQPNSVQDELFHRADKVPFTFRILDRGMFVTKDATANGRLPRGAQVVSLNDRPVTEVIEGLMPLVKSDGSNDGKRLYDLQVTGYGEYEPFDVYYPLMFPPTGGQYSLELILPGTSEPVEFVVDGVTREQRRTRLAERYGAQPQKPEDLWQFERLDESTAYLRLGSFVTWKMEMNWKKFLRKSFETMQKDHVTNLVLDIRGNAGGDDEVNLELARYLVSKRAEMTGVRQLMRYVKVPAELNEYLHTWDDSFRDRGNKVVEAGNGFYSWRDAADGGMKLPVGKDAFGGRVYVLVDAANSSATFILASLLKDNDLATLVGQTTGGNRRGINGGEMFFLRLPNSKLEVDIPLIGFYRGEDQPDEGVHPDVFSEPSPRDIAAGVDAELEAVLRLIAEKM